MEVVLGLNGVYDRSHDSSACIITACESSEPIIVANTEEERFTRSKKAFDQPPHNAASFCLREAGNNIDAIDAITWGWNAGALAASQVLPPELLDGRRKKIETIAVPHHEAHAASVFYTSPYERAAVLVVDGQGETESTTIWSASNKDGLRKVDSLDVNNSLGYLYAAVSKFCGLGSFGAGKLMGLAPYGEPRFIDVIRKVFQDIKLPPQEGKDSQDEFIRQFMTGLVKEGFSAAKTGFTYQYDTGMMREEPHLEKEHRDLAASTQEFLEQEILELANKAKRLTGENYLCMAGGVAMNCVTNSVVQNSLIFRDVYLQPGCEDSGVAMGSALAVLRKKVPFSTPYLGLGYSDSEIASILDEKRVPYTSHDDIEQVTAKLVAQHAIVGWFQGRLEFGPRALGARTILAHPGSSALRDRVNYVKSREKWRPFGPSVLAERADDTFMQSHSSPYMLRSFLVREEWRERLQGVVHVDGSTRPQTVDRRANPRYYDMLKAFEYATGLPGTINTSFNNFDEPIVMTPAQALRTFFATGMDALVLGEHLIRKR